MVDQENFQKIYANVTVLHIRLNFGLWYGIRGSPRKTHLPWSGGSPCDCRPQRLSGRKRHSHKPTSYSVHMSVFGAFGPLSGAVTANKRGGSEGYGSSLTLI